MSDATLNRFLAAGTAAARALFSPSVPSPASGPDPLYLWRETDTGDLWSYSAGVWKIVGPSVRTLTFAFSNGSSDIAAATVSIPVSVPYAGTITQARLLSAVSGSIVIDVWKDTYANHPPTVADTITASAKPTLSSATKATDTTLTGWTTAVAAGDVFIAKVDSCTGITACTLQLLIKVTG